MNVGIKWLKFWISIAFVIAKPNPIPKIEAAVNCETAFPYMSAILLFLANLRLIEALEAEESMKHIFFPILAVAAMSKKYYGNAKVVISIQKARFKTATDISLHFLISASKFLPNLPANKIAPSCPKPSLRTHVYAAAATFAYAIVL